MLSVTEKKQAHVKMSGLFLLHMSYSDLHLNSVLH